MLGKCISPMFYCICKNQEYLQLSKAPDCHADIWINLACCYFFLGMYSEADDAAMKGTDSSVI